MDLPNPNPIALSPRTESPRLWPVRVGLALVVAVYLLYSSFGFAHPVLWGHYGHHTGEYLQRAKTSLRLHMVTPATSAGWEEPTPNFYYFHHPIGYHHIYTVAIALFGDHAWLGAVIPALSGLFLLGALYALVRRWWSREAGLLAVAVYVGLPFICTFSILTDAMFPTMTFSILMVHAYLNYLHSPSRKWLLIACAVTVAGGLLMWEAYMQALFHGIHAFVWMLGRRGRRYRLGPLPAGLAWILATGGVAAATMSFHFLFVLKKGMMDDFLASYHQRHNASFDYIVDRHEEWLRILYGWPIVFIGLVWLAVFVGRAIARRARVRDQAVLIFFIINVVYIILFAQGSAVHMYRVFFFSTFFALAVTDLSIDLYRSIEWMLRSRPVLGRRMAFGTVAALLVVYFAIDIPHAYANLLESRVTMGTQGMPGYNADYAKQLFAMEVAKRTGEPDFVFVHDNLSRRIEFYYYVDRNNANIYSLIQMGQLIKKHPRAVILMDGYPPPGERKLLYELLHSHPGYLFDRYLMIDMRSNKPEFHEYTFEPQKPSWAYRWFVSHKYPPMKLKEVGSVYDACVYAAAGVKPPREIPDPPPPHLGKSDLVMCYHNYQVIRGRNDLAAGYRRTLSTTLVPREARLGSVGHILGMRSLNRTGAELWMTIDKPPPGDLLFRWRLDPVTDEKPVSIKANEIVKYNKIKEPAPAIREEKNKKGMPGVKSVIAASAVPPPRKPIVGEARPNPTWDYPPSETRPGYLYADALKWSVPPGKYHLTVEMGRATPPPPPVRPPVMPPVHPGPGRPGLPLLAPVTPPGKAAPPPAAKAPLAPPTGKASPAPGKTPIAATLIPSLKPTPGAAGPALPPAPAKSPAGGAPARSDGKTAASPAPPPPPPPQPPPPFATADLGIVELR